MTCEEWIAGIRLRGGDCHNKATDVALVGDGKAIMAQMNAALAGRQWFHPKESPWRQMISNKSAEKPNTLIWGARYDPHDGRLWLQGFFVEDPKHIRGALDEAMNHRGPALVNIVLSQGSARKPRQFRWHSQSVAAPMAGVAPATLGRGPLGNERPFFHA